MQLGLLHDRRRVVVDRKRCEIDGHHTFSLGRAGSLGRVHTAAVPFQCNVTPSCAVVCAQTTKSIRVQIASVAKAVSAFAKRLLNRVLKLVPLHL